MKATNIEGDWEIRPEPGGKVWVHMTFGPMKLKLTFTMPARDAKKIAVAFDAAANASRNRKAVSKARRIARELFTPKRR